MKKQIIKKSILSVGDLVGSIHEIVFAQSELEGDPKRLTAKVIVQRGGVTRVLYSVYSSENLPLMSTSNLADAVTRYTALETAKKAESVAEEVKQ